MRTLGISMRRHDEERWQDGIIKDVATYTVGAVVGAGAVLMSLVPANEELVAEVYIKNEDVGFIREGQAAKVKLSTYPFQKSQGCSRAP